MTAPAPAGVPVPVAVRGRDAVGAADRVREAVAAGVEAALAGASGPVGKVHVSWVAALDVAACPAAFRGSGADGWGFPGWSAATGAAAVGRAVLDAALDGIDERRGPGPPPAPLEAVRDWIRTAPAGDGGVVGWVAELRADGDAGTLAALAAGAGRWVAGFLRTFGWPLPADLALAAGLRPPAWRPPGVAEVSVAGGADARLGRVSGAGRFALVVHRPGGGGDDELRDRATFEATAGALTRGIAPEAVVVSSGDTGERVRLAVDDGVLAAGGRMVVAVVEQRVVALDRGFDPADATPSPRCRWCPHRPDCPPGREAHPGPENESG
jgi:hypothetical protein